MTDDKEYYRMTAQEALDDLGSDAKGLSRGEAEKRLGEYGANELGAEIGTPPWLLFLSQFKDLLVMVLIAAAAISFAIGSYRDGTVMVADRRDQCDYWLRSRIQGQQNPRKPQESDHIAGESHARRGGPRGPSEPACAWRHRAA